MVDAVAVLVVDAAVVGVHEGVAAALELVVDARVRLEVVAAGAAAGDELRLEADGLQRLDGLADLGDGGVELGLAVLVLVQVLHRALVGLDAEEAQPGRGGDGLGDLDDRLGGGDAAAAGAAVDLDEDVEGGAVLLRRLREVGDVRHVVDADDDAAAVLRHPREHVDLGRVADFVGDEDVP